MKQRRDLLGIQLSSYKQEKLKGKLPVDTQLLTCAKEDISITKKLVDQMDQMDKLHNEHMQKLSNNMEKLTSLITTGFSLLQGLLYPPPVQPMYQQTGYSFNPSQQGRMPYGPGHISDYHNDRSQVAAMRSPYSELSDHPEQYRGSDQHHSMTVCTHM